MNPLVAVAFGAIQGLTEFLPVSSDGHLALGALFLGVPDMPFAMVLVVHAGTLLATLLVFFRELWAIVVETIRGLRRPRELLATERGRLAVGIVVASVPTAVIGLALEPWVVDWSRVPWIVGVCLLGTAAFLLSTRLARPSGSPLGLVGFAIVGVAQGLAVLPGLSRSGSTIATAMLLGMKPEEAFGLSFLLSIPAVAGAVALELGKPGALDGLGLPALLAGAVAFVTGYAALRALKGLVVRGRLWAFAVYLVPLASGVIVWDLLLRGEG